MAVQIIMVDDPKEYRQVFYDIASNAKGITQSVQVRYDSTKVINRTIAAVAEHRLLATRVDTEQDRVLGSNPNLLGMKHLADIVRTLQVGLGGRVGRRLEAELTEDTVVLGARQYLDTLTASFPDLESVATGELTPEELRRKSLLGSLTMLRVLAGVYRELGSPERAIDLFSRISPLMAAPIAAGSDWQQSAAMIAGAFAPTGRRQDLENLQATILGWE